MAKYRSLIDFGAILAGKREGMNLGLDGSIFIRKEAVTKTFERPRIGTQGSSLGDDTASTDISAGTDASLTVAVDGGAAVTATMSSLGTLNTGALIAAALETAINNALIAGGQDGRVWVQFVSGDAHYEVYSQKTGLTSSVVITNAGANNVADNLKLGLANGGTEAAGTDDQDFLLYTTGGINFSQPAESNPHRTGRFHSGIVKQKKVVEFDMDAMLNMSGSAGASIDTALRLLYESMTGKETVVASTSIDYEQSLPNFTFSVVKCSTIFAEYFDGCYVKDWTLSCPGDAPVTQKFTGMGSRGYIAGIGKVNGAVTASANVVLDNGHADRFEANARVMVVDTDGRTILYGADGTLVVNSVNLSTHTATLNSSVTVADNAYLTFWHPGCVQQTARDNIYTDLQGYFKFRASGSQVACTNIELSLNNEHIDLNNTFGLDHNDGFAAGNRATWNLSVTMDLSNENFGELVRARQFGGLDGELVIGETSGRHLLVDFKKWIVSVPAIDLPENGTTPITFEGVLYQSAAGARDPIKLQFK